MTWKDLTSILEFRRSHLRHVLQSAMLIALFAGLLFNSKAAAQTRITDVIPLDQLDTPTDDLVRLSSGYAEALREFKIAKLSIETVSTLRPNAVVTNLEIQIANLNLEAAKRKVDLLRLIVEKRLAAAENKVRIMEYLNTLGGKPAEAVNGPKEMASFLKTNDEATVEILRAILAMK